VILLNRFWTDLANLHSWDLANSAVSRNADISRPQITSSTSDFVGLVEPKFIRTVRRPSFRSAAELSHFSSQFFWLNAQIVERFELFILLNTWSLWGNMFCV